MRVRHLKSYFISGVMLSSVMLSLSNCSNHSSKDNENNSATSSPESKADSLMIKKIFDNELTQGDCYSNLDYLSNKIGGRLAGSPQAAAAVEWAKQAMKHTEADTVMLQEMMVPHWVRGDKEVGRIFNSRMIGTQDVPVCALGGSIGTGVEGIAAQVVEVHSFAELAKLGREKIEGKIVFFNRPMDPTQIQTFKAYGGAVDQRAQGPSEAAKYGAIGTICRSMSLSLSDFPHTGGMHYVDSIKKIPCIAISTNGAELLSGLLKNDAELKFYFRTTSKTLPDEHSFNVVGEIRGTEHPEEIIVVGGHLDSWETGDGAQDDGAGVVQAMDVIRIFKSLGIKPKRTIRAVAFMNEENGDRGGEKYAELAAKNKEKNIVAIESDAGGFTPRGFSFSAEPAQKASIMKWKPLFEPYGFLDWSNEGGGTDIEPLHKQGTPAMGLSPDSQRYFDVHHTPNDVFKNVNKRELELGAAGMAALIYLLSEHGLSK